ncbi:MAG: FAD-dependent oxidoreductase [Bacillota bacterium]|nr:FAD-dependent oxidoreductase [Bacillota bacterium]
MLDLIIIGGGPSGASAAQKAASVGLNVLLFEKEKFPGISLAEGPYQNERFLTLDIVFPNH